MPDIRELTNASMSSRIFLSIIIGGVVGIERQSKHQPIGARTYMLVCLGACLIMMTNQYVCIYFNSGDPTRMGAQVISGIGFLGAGAILVTKNNQIKGLTTAAGLWVVTGIGLAVGIGFYEGAIMAGVTVLLIMFFFKYIDEKIQMHSRYVRLYLNFDSNNAMDYFIRQCHIERMKIIDMQVSKLKKDTKGGIYVFVTLKSNQRCEHSELIQKLSNTDGIQYIGEV